MRALQSVLITAFMLFISSSAAAQQYDESVVKQIKDKHEVALNQARDAYNAAKVASEKRAEDRISRSINDYKETAMGWKASVKREEVRRMAIMDESYEKEIASKKYEAEKASIENEYKDVMAKEEIKKKEAETAAIKRRRQQAIEKLKTDQAFKKQQEDLKAREKALVEDEKRLAEQRKKAAEIAKKEAELKKREDKLRAEKEKMAKESESQSASEARKKRDEEIQKEVDRRNAELREKQLAEALQAEEAKKKRDEKLAGGKPKPIEPATDTASDRIAGKETGPSEQDIVAWQAESTRLTDYYMAKHKKLCDDYMASYYYGPDQSIRDRNHAQLQVDGNKVIAELQAAQDELRRKYKIDQ